MRSTVTSNIQLTFPVVFLSVVLILSLITFSTGPATAAEPQFEQVLPAKNTMALLEHGGKVLQGLDGGGILPFDREDERVLERWTSGQELSGNFISDMTWTGQNIWIATIGSGMTRITNLDTNPEFRQYTNNLGDLDITAVTGTVIGDGERVFYGMDGKGVGQINSGLSGNIYTAGEDGLISNDITTLQMLGSDLFVGTPVGISRFSNNTFTDQNNGLTNLMINDLIVDADGNLLAASNAGIHQWDTVSETWSLIGNIGSWVVDLASMSGKVYALGLTATGDGVLSQYDGTVWNPMTLPFAQCTAIDAGEELWVSGPTYRDTDGGRLTYNYLGKLQGDGTFTTWVSNSTQVSNCIGAAFDAEGRTWMGDFSGRQITRYDTRSNSYFYIFERPHAANDTLNLFPGLGPVLCIAGAPDGTVFAGQYVGGGILKINTLGSGTTDRIDPTNSGLQGRGVVNMVVHPDGPLIVMHDWTDLQNVEILVDPDNWSGTESWVLPPMDQGLGNGPSVWDALVEKRDIIWFAVEGGGLVRWDVNGPDAGPNDPLTWFDPSDDVWYDPITGFPGSTLDPRAAAALTLGRDGSLWAGGNGLVQFTYELTGGTSLAVTVIQDLEEKNPSTPEIEGLVNGNVGDIATDNNGDIWVATRTGLNRVSPRGEEAHVTAWIDVGNYLSNPNYGLLYSPNVIAPLPGQTYARILASPDKKQMLLSSDQGTTLITVGSGPSVGGSEEDPLKLIYSYPNPWTPGGNADRLKLGRLPSETVAVEIYNLEGQPISRYNSVAEDTGFWEGDNSRTGRPAASGLYIMKITSGGRTTTRIVALER